MDILSTLGMSHYSLIFSHMVLILVEVHANRVPVVLKIKMEGSYISNKFNEICYRNAVKP